MRKSEAQDAWRRLVRNRGLRLTNLALAPVAPFGEIDISLPNGLVVICGLNGAGKTSILRLIEATLNGVASVARRTRPALLDHGGFSVEVEFNSEPVRVAIGEDASPVSALVLDPFELCARARMLASQPNYEDVFEGVEPYVLKESELEDANYVLGIRYELVEVFEVEEPGTEHTLALPRVTRSGLSYSSKEMGTGELASLMLLWGLLRADKGSILLIEEPESFLSSHSAVALMDILARQVSQARLYVVVTTHSTDIVTRVPSEHVRTLVPTPRGMTLRTPTNHAELERQLGSFGGQSRVIFVEDRMAKALVTELLGRFADLWGQAIQVIDVGGVEKVIGICQSLPHIDSLIACGVLDGDQRNRKLPETNWLIEMLPGDVDPGSMLREATEANLPVFAERLGRTEAQTISAIEQSARADFHDWFFEVAGHLSVTEDVVLRSAIGCWLADATNAESATTFVERISSALVRTGSNRS